MKYAVILTIYGDAIVAPYKPIPVATPEDEQDVRQEHENEGTMVIVADKETLMNNPFDLSDEDFIPNEDTE